MSVHYLVLPDGSRQATHCLLSQHVSAKHFASEVRREKDMLVEISC